MKTDIFYYFLSKNNERIIMTTDYWVGDIGDKIIYKDELWTIEDYTWEFYDLEMEMMY